MIVVRRFLAAVIAVSVAVAPVTAGAAASVTPVQMSMADSGDMPCCPPDESKTSFTCAFKCFNVAAALIPAEISLMGFVDQTDQPSFTNETLHGHISPPTHPAYLTVFRQDIAARPNARAFGRSSYSLWSLFHENDPLGRHDIGLGCPHCRRDFRLCPESKPNAGPTS